MNSINWLQLFALFKFQLRNNYFQINKLNADIVIMNVLHICYFKGASTRENLTIACKQESRKPVSGATQTDQHLCIIAKQPQVKNCQFGVSSVIKRVAKMR